MRNTKFQRVVSFLLAMTLLLGAGVISVSAAEVQDEKFNTVTDKTIADYKEELESISYTEYQKLFGKDSSPSEELKYSFYHYMKPELVDEVMFGGVLTTALGQNVARQVGVKAGIPYSVPAYTVNMVCGSGMKTVIEAARTILAGDAEIIVCGGTENMSQAPFALPDERWGARMGDGKMVDTGLVQLSDGL